MSRARRFERDRRDHHAMPSASTLHDAAIWLMHVLLRWLELAQQRRRLLALDDRMLKDIGITRAEAMQEGTRPFWDTAGLDRPRWS
jgi:uncharacterized protein YjiS (DUF1127 family)